MEGGAPIGKAYGMMTSPIGRRAAAGFAGQCAMRTAGAEEPRPVRQSFNLAEHPKVTNATFEHGVLTVQLKREVPEGRCHGNGFYLSRTAMRGCAPHAISTA